MSGLPYAGHQSKWHFSRASPFPIVATSEQLHTPVIEFRRRLRSRHKCRSKTTSHPRWRCVTISRDRRRSMGDGVFGEDGQVLTMWQKHFRRAGPPLCLPIFPQQWLIQHIPHTDISKAFGARRAIKLISNSFGDMPAERERAKPPSSQEFQSLRWSHYGTRLWRIQQSSPPSLAVPSL